MVALVTGAFGFLGEAISKELSDAGWDVVPAGRPACEIPSSAFTGLLEHSRPELVVHCASPASVPASVDEPAEDFAGSAGVFAHVLGGLCRCEPQPRCLLLSSAAVYGEPQSLPVSESDPLAAVSPYGFHRIASESLASEFGNLFGLRIAIMRIFSAYGEGLERQILWDACRQGAIDGRIELHGTGRESRDFIHATDVARAALLIAERGRFEGEHYNVGSGRETTIAELAELIRIALELPGDAVSFRGDARHGDPLNWRADVSRLTGLGFRAETTLEEGVGKYTQWARRTLAAGAPV